jgi:TetR/AcrR family transcriptional repressor of mexJK operon
MAETDPADPPRPRGRPRDPERLARVLQAAKKHFTEHGYEGVSVDAIAEASGVSKVTIYSYFSTKEALFQAAVMHRVDSQFEDVDWRTLDPTRPEQALTSIGRAFLALMRSPDVINHHRTLYGAQRIDPAPAQTFFTAGPLKLVGSVAQYLSAADRAGSLEIRNPAQAADQFLALFLGLAHIRALLGLGAPDEREDQALLKSNVQMFLRAHARAGGVKTPGKTATRPSRRPGARR